VPLLNPETAMDDERRRRVVTWSNVLVYGSVHFFFYQFLAFCWDFLISFTLVGKCLYQEYFILILKNTLIYSHKFEINWQIDEIDRCHNWGSNLIPHFICMSF
jgi:hypothetical protein